VSNKHDWQLLSQKNYLTVADDRRSINFEKGASMKDDESVRWHLSHLHTMNYKRFIW